MSFLRKMFGLSAKNTPLNDIKQISTSKLPIPDVGGEYYVRFWAKNNGGMWSLSCETNCKLVSNGKRKSLESFVEAKKNHFKNDQGNSICLETVILVLADLENAHLQYSKRPSPLKQDKKTHKYHYVHVLDKMPDDMQDAINDRWTEYQESNKGDGILPKAEQNADVVKRTLPGRRPSNPNNGLGHGHRH